MGIVSSYPTSYLLQSDSVSEGLFIHYNPD